MRLSLRHIALVAGLSASGCATVDPRPGFEEVSRTVAERTGMQVVWDAGAPEDEAIRSMVDRTLAAPIDEAAAVQVALLCNRSLRAVYEELAVAQADVVQAGLLRNPVFDVAVLLPDGGGQTSLAFALTQSFLETFQIPLRKRLAETEYEVAKLRVTEAVVAHVAATRKTFHALVAAERLALLGRSEQEAAEAAAELARRLRAAGNITSIELVERETTLVETALEVARKEAMAALLRERLNVAMGLHGARTAWTTAGEAAPPEASRIELPEIERRAVEANFDLAALRRAIEREALALGIERPAALLGDLTLGVGIERDFGDPWQIGPVGSIAIPIFDQGQATVARGEARLRAALERFAAEAVAVRAAARAAGTLAMLAEQRVTNARTKLVPLRNQAFEESQRRFGSMQIGTFELLQARLAQIAAQRIEVIALRDAWLARCDLDAVLAGQVGGLLGAAIFDGVEAGG
ncbi:MAG TPA: TolC family protein [Phycisphaerales bacterium]|nr:TolC family protein [Phycisphaerales bacterium]HMP36164.1 TolC family protein [Phycisphaerales bacterium]